jgi:UPF0755 protein
LTDRPDDPTLPPDGGEAPAPAEPAPYDHEVDAPADAGCDDDAGWAEHEYDDGDYEEVVVSGRSRGRRIVLWSILAVLVIGVAGLAAAGLWVQRQINPPGGPGEAIAIEVPLGATTDDIGRLLAAEAVIADRTVWRWYIRINGAGPFQAGLYELRKSSAMGDVVSVLDAGPSRPPAIRFTVPEGLTLEQTLDRLADPERGLGLSRERMAQLLEDGTVRSRYQDPEQASAEGILFPETYEVPADADEEVVLRRMVDQLDRTLDQLGVEAAQERFNLTPYEILVVASMIERESRVEAERPKVARVVYNRLSQGIPLGIDATSCYEKGEIPCRLVTADFESDSPYNTRRVPGLPPTPIGSPGRASIAAALEPEDGPWIFYVLADAQGNHFFTDSAQEFERAKQACIRQGLGCG